VKYEFFGPENDGFADPEVAVSGAATDSTVDDAADLFADLGDFETGSIPVDAVLKQGRAIRVRRRVVGSAALAVAAALSIGVPVAIAGGGSAGIDAGSGAGPNGVYAATSSGGRATVNPTPFAGGKGQFTGTVDGKKWSVDFDNKNCFYIAWSCGFPDLYPWDKYASLAADSSWGLQGQPDDYTLFLNKNVARATITLQDGEVLRLEAVPTVNNPVVLFALPFGLGVSKLELFDTRGAEIAYSMPFNIPGSASVGADWYLPGVKPSPGSGSAELARADTGPGGKTVITAYASPSGLCVVTEMAGHPGANCHMGPPVNGSVAHPVGMTVDSSGKAQYSGGESVSGLVASNIDHMRLDFSDGTKSPVAIKSVEGHRFFAYIVPKGKNLTSLTAFNSAGIALPVQKNTQ
jgi:hypothetical protein